ncbi:RagB/SusD family nutrient uptake outer membrane protein [Sphingobacterium sp. SRCM116780]|uniref:RagB/SusD family nutrient uptake outer membrane protein n=1 Tax=Sphingobacterium sp. SRCM116780 TaxID=2907623 RepID=UPI001F24E9F7|nr:RagB/SusD family nutrient uptake outer membrane protein [Sphingobacterium sp. SRCM116780]UIR56968.1 RagB/SusD family nutrient uptake outer membrane protein [Sphingobacterium sp. SRCM116780]
MKTKINSMYIYMLSIILLGSCSLDEEPYGFYSEDNFYKTAEDATSSLLYAYNAATHNEYARSIFYINELATESIDVKGEEGFGAQEINKWDYNQFKQNEQLELFYKYSYIGINRANAVIENVVGSNINEDVKNKLVGEALFLRAWNYFSLATMFGRVPIHKEMIKTADQAQAPLVENLNELYSFIIQDASRAQEYLSINRSVGRADKVAAQALLAKVYLTMASAKESNVSLYRDIPRDVKTMYDSAAYWSSKVLTEQSTYKFDENLLNIYDVKHPDGPEHIFLLSLDKSGIAEGNFSSIDKLFMPYKDGAMLYFKNLDGTYTGATNRGWGVFKITEQFANTFADNDLRKSTLMSKGFYKDANGTNWQDNDYWLTRKFIDPDFVGEKSSVKPFLIRFSEVALIYAEAVGPTPEGYNWLNKIRNRAGLSAATAGMSVSNFRNAVVQERYWELAYEGKHLLDLRRKGRVTQTNPHALSAGVTEEQASFYPIPQKEIDLNSLIH